MNSKKALNIPAIISYLSWIGWVIALIVRDPADRFAAHHLNQALILNIISILVGIITRVPLLGGIVSFVLSLAALVLWIMGIYRAIMWDDRPLPLIGDIHLMG